MDAIQITDTLAYPWNSKNVPKRLIIGATITVLGVFFFPLFISLGYYTRSLTDTIAGKDRPPELSSAELWPLFKIGSGAMAIIAGYATLTLLGSAGITALLGVATTGGLITENIAAHMTVFALVTVVLATITAYVLPASLAQYGQSSSILAGFRLFSIATTSMSIAYVLGVGFSLLLSSVIIATIAISSVIPLVGVLLALTAKFPTVLIVSRAHGNSISSEQAGVVHPVD